jgi:hypothetical protein
VHKIYLANLSTKIIIFLARREGGIGKGNERERGPNWSSTGWDWLLLGSAHLSEMKHHHHAAVLASLCATPHNLISFCKKAPFYLVPMCKTCFFFAYMSWCGDWNWNCNKHTTSDVWELISPRVRSVRVPIYMLMI